MSKHLDNIRLGYSPLSNTIYMYRHGKNPQVALEKRNAEAEVMAALVSMMMQGAPRGSEMDFTLGDKRYTIRVTPKETEGT